MNDTTAVRRYVKVITCPHGDKSATLGDRTRNGHEELLVLSDLFLIR